jgi:hypothetical protein
MKIYHGRLNADLHGCQNYPLASFFGRRAIVEQSGVSSGGASGCLAEIFQIWGDKIAPRHIKALHRHTRDQKQVMINCNRVDYREERNMALCFCDYSNITPWLYSKASSN